MMNRQAFASLGNAKRIDLQELVGPLVAECTIATVFAHWPDELKEGIKAEFFDNLNKAEFEYEKCDCLLNHEEPFSQKSLLIKLAQNIANQCANPTDKELIWKVVETSFKRLNQMDMTRLVMAAKEGLSGSANN
jgi:hypothetical protein